MLAWSGDVGEIAEASLLSMCIAKQYEQQHTVFLLVRSLAPAPWPLDYWTWPVPPGKDSSLALDPDLLCGIHGVWLCRENDFLCRDDSHRFKVAPRMQV